MHNAFLYSSYPSLQDYNVKVPNVTICRRREYKTTTFWIVLNFILLFNFFFFNKNSKENLKKIDPRNGKLMASTFTCFSIWVFVQVVVASLFVSKNGVPYFKRHNTSGFCTLAYRLQIHLFFFEHPKCMFRTRQLRPAKYFQSTLPYHWNFHLLEKYWKYRLQTQKRVWWA